MFELGRHYQWKHDPDPELVYVGKKGLWHQFAKIEDRSTVWCEVLDEDAHLLEALATGDSHDSL